MSEQDITLKVVLDQILTSKNEMNGRFDRLERRVDRLDRNLTGQIDMVDQRLDRIEIVAAEQRYNDRIRKLEEHAGLAA